MSIKDSSHTPDSSYAARPEDLKTKGYLSKAMVSLRNPYAPLSTGMHQIATEVRQLLSDLHYTLTDEESTDNGITSVKIADFNYNGVRRYVELKHGALFIDARLTESGQLAFSFSEHKRLDLGESQETEQRPTNSSSGVNSRHPANAPFSLLRMMYSLEEADKLYRCITGKVRSSPDDGYIASHTYSDDRIYTWEFDILTDYVNNAFIGFAERRNLDVWHCFSSQTTLKILLTDS